MDSITTINPGSILVVRQGLLILHRERPEKTLFTCFIFKRTRDWKFSLCDLLEEKRLIHARGAAISMVHTFDIAATISMVHTFDVAATISLARTFDVAATISLARTFDVAATTASYYKATTSTQAKATSVAKTTASSRTS